MVSNYQPNLRVQGGFAHEFTVRVSPKFVPAAYLFFALLAEAGM
jgi:hypothetical protein